MNVQEYISSGIVESYVLGLASPQDSAEFERMCATHSEVLAARESFELQLEQSLQQEKQAAPDELKSSIFSRIEKEKQNPSPKKVLAKPTLIPRIGFARYVAAASLILLAGSVLLNFYLLSQYKKTIAQNRELTAAQSQVAEANQSLQTKLKIYENSLSRIKDPQMEIIKMPAVPTSPAPSGLATVYWENTSRDVYLLINRLPKPAAGKQYQLWAIVDGKPVSAGVFDLEDGASLIKLKKIPKAEAFAITLEKRGGSVTPTMDAMFVMGKVTG